MDPIGPSLEQLTEAEIIRRLAAAYRAGAGRPPEPDANFPLELLQSEPRPAAVLIPLLKREKAWHVLYTLRTSTLAEHSGQVAFPGGRADPDDSSPEATALREAQEEIGLDPSGVRVLGRLNEFVTITNYHVTPVVGVIPWPFPLHLAEEEVERVFTIPLAWLADPSNHEIRRRELPPPHDPVEVIYFLPYEDAILWGASARFTLTLLQNLGVNHW